MWFLDTNICIFYLNGTNPAVRARLLGIPPKDIAIPAIVKAELVFGARKSTRSGEMVRIVERFLEPFEIKPFDSGACEEYAEIRFSLEIKGTPIGPNDLLIAAITRHHRGVLVTNNQREFSRIPGLKLEDWSFSPSSP